MRMLETFVITFREGLEAFLIVALILAYVRKTGRKNLIKPIYSGVIAALAISATTGSSIADLAQDPLWEGVLALISGALVASFTFYIMRTAKHIRQNIHAAIDRKAAAEGVWAEIGIFLFVVVMIAREGMEVALMLGTISTHLNAGSMLLGGTAGLLGVALIGYLWASQSQYINLRLFMQTTGIFLVLFSIHLFFYGLHELSEMNYIPFIGDDMNIRFHVATEDLAETGVFEGLISLGLVVLPFIWLVQSYLRNRRNQQAQAAE